MATHRPAPRPSAPSLYFTLGPPSKIKITPRADTLQSASISGDVTSRPEDRKIKPGPPVGSFPSIFFLEKVEGEVRAGGAGWRGHGHRALEGWGCPYRPGLRPSVQSDPTPVGFTSGQRLELPCLSFPICKIGEYPILAPASLGALSLLT